MEAAEGGQTQLPSLIRQRGRFHFAPQRQIHSIIQVISPMTPPPTQYSSQTQHTLRSRVTAGAIQAASHQMELEVCVGQQLGATVGVEWYLLRAGSNRQKIIILVHCLTPVVTGGT